MLPGEQLNEIEKIKSLPREIQLDILANFSHDQLQQICKTEKHFSQICKDMSLWKNKVQITYPKKFHWYSVWSDLYQTNDWREFYIFLKQSDTYNPVFTLELFIYLVINFTTIPDDLSQEQINELAEKSLNHQDMLFCGINTPSWQHIHTDSDARTNEKVQFTMELMSEFPLDGYVFLPNEEVTVGHAFGVINEFNSIYPEVNSGDIVKIKFEPTRRIMYILVELYD